MMMDESEPWIHGHPLCKTPFQRTYAGEKEKNDSTIIHNQQ